MKGKKSKLSIIIPVRNEGVNIGLMLRILNAVTDIPHEILVVYDFPEDDTVPVVKKLQKKIKSLRLVHNTLGKGIPNALKAGIQNSKGGYILILMADEVGPAMAIDDMMALAEDGCEFISATRYAHGGRRLGGSPLGKLVSRTGNKLFPRLSGCVFSDSTTGIKMFSKKVYNEIDLDANPTGWAVVFELAIKAQAKCSKVGEVPIISIDRLYGGESTFSFVPWFKQYTRWFVFGVKYLRSQKTKPKLVIRVPTSTIK